MAVIPMINQCKSEELEPLTSQLNFVPTLRPARTVKFAASSKFAVGGHMTFFVSPTADDIQVNSVASARRLEHSDTGYMAGVARPVIQMVATGLGISYSEIQ
ncbi:hypothetical protein D9757_010965 [Collybiopsis confluens]|uniref:Uncharacterized protein n=1 Tax=Collybiopsis confluens TaxID=2823264 RepID=A0A8H5LSB0_9AGAR|nr:hypothetical protein D9757_010965 [Collybiopsis confluens]